MLVEDEVLGEAIIRMSLWNELDVLSKLDVSWTAMEFRLQILQKDEVRNCKYH